MSILVQLTQSQYVRQVATLLTGTAIAQLISLAATPILTRVYGPESFGTLALFVAVVSALAPGVGGRYEVAVVVARNAQERQGFLLLALWVTTTLCVLFLIVLLVASRPIVSWLSAHKLGGWILVAPAALFITGVVATLRAYANAVKDYQSLSRSQVVQTLAVSVLAIGLGVAGILEDGLLYANVVGLGLGCAYLLYVFRPVFQGVDWRWNRQKMALAWRHKDYPLFNATTNVLNGIMTGLPVFFLTKYYSDVAVGYYALLTRVGVVPLSFVAEAISRVNIKKVAELVHEQRDPIPYIRAISVSLLLVAAVPTVLLMVAAPRLFGGIFGENWRAAGDLLVILMPALAVQFVVSTLSLAFVAAGHLRLQAVWQVLSLGVTVVVFQVVSQSSDLYRFFWAFAIKDVGLYTLYYAFLVYALKHPKTTPKES